MSNKKSKKTGPTKIILFLLGDEEKDNKNFIKAYHGKEIDSIEKSELIEFNKKIEEEEYTIMFYHLSEKDDKMIPLIQESNSCLILFNMSERISFDNLLDKWLIWLRDNCKYEGAIFIFGDYQPEDNDQDIFLATSDDEVQQVINCAELKAIFKKIGNLDEDQRREGIDEVLKTLVKMPSEQKNTKDNQGGSMKNGCVIF